jgi:hypothetical protein
VCGVESGRKLGIYEGLRGGALRGVRFGVDVCGKSVSCPLWRRWLEGRSAEGRGIGETYMGGSRGMWLLEAWLCEVDVKNGD